MGFSFRKSIKILPGVRVNLSRRGISTSFSAKGFTYNTRGRLTASIPGTGISYTRNIKSQTRHKPDKAAFAVVEHVNAGFSESLSKRERTTRDFVQLVQQRTRVALHQYFLSHGVFVSPQELTEALTLEAHQEFFERLSPQFETTSKAIRLADDIGSISLAEKQKAMAALYEIESRCEQARGERGALEVAAVSLERSIGSWPASPNFFGAFCLGLIGCGFLYAGAYAIGFVVLAVAMGHGWQKLSAFEKKKRYLRSQIEAADAEFDSLLTEEISQRPTAPVRVDNARFNAIVLAVVMCVMSTATLGFRTMNGVLVAPAPGVSEEVTQSAAASVAQGNSSTPDAVPDFAWLVGKQPWEAVKDQRFRAAFNHVPRMEWKRFSDRLALSDSKGIQLKDGYYFAEGCKAHSCNTDIAAFAISAATGKGDLIYATTPDQPSGKSVGHAFSWTDMPVASTPLAAWLTLNGL
ncbi:DUF4236 domain-containing protein [Caballeronia sp. BCC1704]|uniref:DUF4236 domain-containing protein n=1 Tax=Caballeronia sp. BCC1704 TaxID=2676300 RepID=UPI00158AC0DF|nr:DUF4236 domain-containing protein [Caballeronia sp. BCC1704]